MFCNSYEKNGAIIDVIETSMKTTMQRSIYVNLTKKIIKGYMGKHMKTSVANSCFEDLMKILVPFCRILKKDIDSQR